MGSLLHIAPQTVRELIGAYELHCWLYRRTRTSHAPMENW
jgi:hypothetical protein